MLKPPSTARTAGRSDWAERRFRRQPFILLSFSSPKKARKVQETQSYQRFQHIGHTGFNTSGTNASHLLPLTKVGTHSALLKESHTEAHTPKQGPSLLRSQLGFVLPAKFLLFRHAFIYIHFPVLCEPHYISRGKNSGKVAAINFIPNRSSLRFSAFLANGPRSLSRVKAGTHSPSPTGSHTAAHTPKHGRFGYGWYYYPRSVPHVHKHPRAGCQNGVLCRFWVLVRCAPEGHREPSEQRCAYACRCPEASRPRWAALLCLQFGDVAVFSLCAQYFLSVQGGRALSLPSACSACC